MKLHISKLQILITAIFLGFVVWWVSFQPVVEAQGLSVQWFGGTYGVVALFGAIIGLFASVRWGGLHSVLGKAITFFALGLLAQEAGQLIYTYYVYGAQVQIPYPSWGDAAYFGSVVLYTIAVLFLARAAGAGIPLKSMRYRVLAVLIPVVLLTISYVVLLNGHQYDYSKPLTVFLDFGYPMGQAIYISIAIAAYLLCRKLLGGVLWPAVITVLFALFIQYVSDFTFIYQSNRGTYLAGKFDDLFYLIAYFVMATAMIQFSIIHGTLVANAKQHVDEASSE